MARAANLNPQPTILQEVNFISNVYTNDEQLFEVLEQNGYRFYKNINIPKVKCFFYTPKTFPHNSNEVIFDCLLTTKHEVSQMADFDFSEHKNKRLTLGICIGGTAIHNGWDEKVQLAIQGLLQIRDNRVTADRTATMLYQALEDFLEDFPELSQYRITLDIRICGYSLGGLFSQVATILLQDWVHTTRSRLSCRTYESCGIPQCYHEIGNNYTEGDSEYWHRRIKNYKTFPNPFNTVFRDIGKVYHLMNINSIFSNGWWVGKCIAGSSKRVLFYGSAGTSVLGSLTGISYSTISVAQTVLAISTCMAAEFGFTCAEMSDFHKIGMFKDCFDAEGNQLENICYEMRRWPVYSNLLRSILETINNAAHGMVLFSEKNAGLHTLFFYRGKKGFIDRKLLNCPGYERIG